MWSWPEAEVIDEWRRETHVLTNTGSRETKLRTIQLASWKKTKPRRIGTSSIRLLKEISKKTETPHITKVAKKNAPALFSISIFLLLLLLRAITVLPCLIFCGSGCNSGISKVAYSHQLLLGKAMKSMVGEMGEEWYWAALCFLRVFYTKLLEYSKKEINNGKKYNSWYYLHQFTNLV